MRDKQWEGPREKIRTKGVASLTTLELLQVVIGSGNSYASVAKIARKTLRLLSREGASVDYEQLSSVPGLGPARVCQILALFEIASRYSTSASRLLLDTEEKSLALMSDVRNSKQESVVVVTLDGGYHLISSHLFHLLSRSHIGVMRKMFESVLKDRAERVVVGVGCKTRGLEPTVDDLAFARDMYAMAKLFRIKIKNFLIVNNSEERVYDPSRW